MANAHENFIRQSSLFSASRLLCALLSLGRSFLIARWLGPAALGTWQFIQIFERYSSYASLGTRSAISRKVPYLKGKGDTNSLEIVLNNAFAANFFGPLIYSISILVFSFCLKEGGEAITLSTYSLVILLSSWTGYNSIVFMSLGLYSYVNRFEIIDNLISTLLCSVLAYFYGVNGVIMGFFISTLVAFTIGSRQLWRRFSFNIETQDFFELIKFGLPMMGISILTTTMTVIDRIMIAMMLDRETLGIYSVANVGIGIMRTISTSMGQLFLVKFAEMHGQNRSLKNTASAIDKALEGLSCFVAPLVAGMVSIFPIIVWLLLPRFMEGIAAGKLLIAESFFLSLSLPTANWCVATGRYMTVIVTRGSLVIAEAVGIYLLLKNGAELKWVAGYVLSISAFFCLSMIVIVNKILKGKIIEGFIRSIYVIAPSTGVFIAIAVQELVYEKLKLPEGSRLVISFILGTIASLPICLPFVLRANRILGITRLITHTSKVLC